MTIELVDGKAGRAHISSEDKAIIHQAKFSKSDVVFDWGDVFKCTMGSANRATIGTGCASIQGLDWHITAAESVTISNGSQGMKRNDIICAHYHRNSSGDTGDVGIESVELTVLKGTPNATTAADPTIPSGKILSGAVDAYMPLWRIPLDGITVGTPVRLFTPRAALWDSLTQRSTTWRVPYSSDSILLTRIGDICFMGGNVKFNSSGQNNYTKAQEKLPEGYRPVIVNTPVAVFGGETTFICYGEANGTVTMLGNPNSAYAGCTGVWRTADPMPAA